jgi:hypothetical protein
MVIKQSKYKVELEDAVNLCETEDLYNYLLSYQFINNNSELASRQAKLVQVCCFSQWTNLAQLGQMKFPSFHCIIQLEAPK